MSARQPPQHRRAPALDPSGLTPHRLADTAAAGGPAGRAAAHELADRIVLAEAEAAAARAELREVDQLAQGLDTALTGAAAQIQRLAWEAQGVVDREPHSGHADLARHLDHLARQLSDHLPTTPTTETS